MNGAPAALPRPALGSSMEPSCRSEWSCAGTVVYVPTSDVPCGSSSVPWNM